MSKQFIKSNFINAYFGRTGIGIKYSTRDYETRNHYIVIRLFFITIFITLPWKSKDWSCDPEEYGIETYKTVYKKWYDLFDQLYISFGHRCWFIEMPWYLDWVYTAIQDKDGSWLVEDYRYWKLRKKYAKYFDNILNDNPTHYWQYDTTKKFQSKFYYTYTYTYKPLNQTSECKYYVCERCWRPKWFKWTDIFSLKIRTIEVEFKNGMGPGVDDWKGGTYGISFDMKETETPEECIKRMEKEYQFN